MTSLIDNLAVHLVIIKSVDKMNLNEPAITTAKLLLDRTTSSLDLHISFSILLNKMEKGAKYKRHEQL